MTAFPAIILRAPEPSDVDALYLWENDPEAWSVTDALAPVSRHQLWEYVNNYDSNPLSACQLRLIIAPAAEPSARPLGVIDLFDINPLHSHASVGIYVAASARRQGIASAALSALISYCRDRLPLLHLSAVVAVGNVPSSRLFSSAGFRPLARLPRWIRSGAPGKGNDSSTPSDGFTDATLFIFDL